MKGKKAYMLFNSETKVVSTVIAVMVGLLFLSCNNKAAQSNVNDVDFRLGQKVETDEQKVDRIMSLMSPRAQKEIVIQDKTQFVKDLNVVLAEEASFRADDLSLYYLIDKKHTVESTYVPKDLVSLKANEYYSLNRNDLSLRPDVEAALRKMSKAALEDGIKLLVSSTYRSYEYQEKLFNRYVAADGLELAERYSARPGTSQHQLGTAIDFGSITDDFADTRMGKWVYNHASEYGWSLSFPKGYEDITGYMWECWHFRYIGVPACQLQKKYFLDVQQYMIEFIDLWKNN